MKPRHERSLVPLLLWLTFFAGGVGGWLLRSAIAPSAPLTTAATLPVRDVAVSEPAIVTSNPPPPVIRAVDPAGGSADDDLVDELRDRKLQLPVDGIDVKLLKGQFGDKRDGGKRGHEAVDMLAPRNTPVRAVDAGTIAKLFVSNAGGNTIYQFDPAGRACYYYAHLESYAAGLHEGQAVNVGQIIGYVGTTGNAPPDTPHLHFAVFELTAERQWWKGTPLDPYEIYKR